MKSFNTDLKQVLMTSYSDPEKATEYYSSEEYTSCFWDFESLEAHAGEICRMFALNNEQWHYSEETNQAYFYREIEGYGTFIRQDDGKYVMEHESTGKITISIESELEVEWCTENAEAA